MFDEADRLPLWSLAVLSETQGSLEVNSGPTIVWRKCDKAAWEGRASSVSFDFLLKSEHQSACCPHGWWGEDAGGRWVMSFGITFVEGLLGSCFLKCCASPSEVSSLPLAVSIEMGTHSYAKITQGWKTLHLPMVSLSWRWIGSHVWTVAMVIKSNFLRPGI